MPNQYVNKVVQSNGTTIIDISDSTATVADVAQGKFFYLPNGQKAEGVAGGGSMGGQVWQDQDGYIHLSDEPADQIELQTITKTYTPTTSQQTETITPGSGYDGIGQVNVTVSAMPSGTAGTPTATKGTVSNNSVSVTPSVTNTTGYITGSTKTGTAVSVSASELVSGTKSISSNGTGIDVTNFASVDVSVPTGTARTSADLTVSGDTVTVPAGLYSSNATKSVASGTAGTPTATKGTVSNHSVAVTPSVTNTTGYITGSTKTGTAVTVSASELVSGSETKTANGTYDVTNLASLVVNVSGGGGSSNFTLLGTLAVGSISTSSTTATDTGKSITVKGIYDYDLLVIECAVGTKTNNRHVATTRLCWLTAGNAIGTKNGATFATATWNVKLSSNGTATSRSNTTPYGIYANGCTVSEGSTGDNGQAVITIYQRYNSTQTGTINGTYTAKVYGVKLWDLI